MASQDILGHSPSIKEYRRVRDTSTELSLPSDRSIRRWLGAGWNDCLQQALLAAVSDGDFESRPIGLNDRFEDEQVLDAVRQCAQDLGYPANGDRVLRLGQTPDVMERPGRRPRSFKPFDRFGGFRPALEAAAVIDGAAARYSATGHVLPQRYRYIDDDLLSALRLIARELGHSPRASEYGRQRQRLRAEAERRGGRSLAST